MDEPKDPETDHRLTLILALNSASKALQIKPVYSVFLHENSKAIEAVLKLGIVAERVVCSEPSLSELSELLGYVATLFEKLQKLRGCDVATLFYRQITKLEISRVARSIETLTRSFLDRELIEKLLSASTEPEKVRALAEFVARLSLGFDGDFQELVLRRRVFDALQLTLRDDSERVRGPAALAILALVEFNKDVFVGLVLMGPTVESLVSTASVTTVRVLWSLIGRVRTILVDEIESAGEIPRIVNLLDSEDIRLRLAATEVALEIACFGKREAVETMVVGECLVKKLMDLQRDMERVVDQEKGEVSSARENYVARLASQVQIGEGLENREKKELRSEILRLVGEYSDSEAESVSIASDILWGSCCPSIFCF